MQITTGKKKMPCRVVLYGVEGIGKTTLAAQFPRPLFIDTENGSHHLDVARCSPTNWDEIIVFLDQLSRNTQGFQTVVIDTMDWLEEMAVHKICAAAGKSALGDFGHGKGYVALSNAFSALLKKLDACRAAGMNIVLIGHSHIKRFESPEYAGGSYDRYELKLSKRLGPLIKEWSDCILFANWQVVTIEDERTKKKRAANESRVIYTQHSACWDAKNRYGLKKSLKMEFDEIRVIAAGPPETATEQPQAAAPASAPPAPQVAPQAPAAPPVVPTPAAALPKPIPQTVERGKKMPMGTSNVTSFAAELYKLMERDGITDTEIREAVAKKGTYPEECAIERYDQEFIDTVLIRNWDKLTTYIKNNR